MTQQRPKPAESATAPTPGGLHTGRIAVIDGLRLFAALIVALYHYTALKTAMGPVWDVPRGEVFPVLSRAGAYGWLGVELFFMISGFVICMSSWGRTPEAFARSRIVRLFPAYWPAVLITTAVVTLWPTVQQHASVKDVLVNLTMLNDPLNAERVDEAYWTLWAEAKFYLLFAVVLLWRGRGLTLRNTILFGYGWLIAATLTVNAKQPVLTEILQPVYAPYFVAGIAFYLIHRFGPDIRLWGLAGLSFALAMNAVNVRMTNRDLNPHIGMLVVALFFAALAVIALGWTDRIRWRWLTTAGILTYPFYLIHENIGWTIIHATRDLAPRYVILVGVLLLMLGAAWLLHRLLERPIAGWLRAKLTPHPGDPASHDQNSTLAQPSDDEIRLRPGHVPVSR
ncbi:acyltransferase [Actinoplanes sp. NPDC049118]|uniref:acyltransferase family protein n=1 Tax=Actinoplanes sp. NPDC049118 TaxID=3155769 RepID=UPI0034057F2F